MGPSFWLRQTGSMTFHTKDHVACNEMDGGIGVRGATIEQRSDSFPCCFMVHCGSGVVGGVAAIAMSLFGWAKFGEVGQLHGGFHLAAGLICRLCTLDHEFDLRHHKCNWWLIGIAGPIINSRTPWLLVVRPTCSGTTSIQNSPHIFHRASHKAQPAH